MEDSRKGFAELSATFSLYCTTILLRHRDELAYRVRIASRFFIRVFSWKWYGPEALTHIGILLNKRR